MSELRLVFVLSPWQNAFFHEVAEILCDELRAGGVVANGSDRTGSHRARR